MHVSIREANKVWGHVSPDVIFWPMAGDGGQWGLEDKMILRGTYESTYFNLFYLYVLNITDFTFITEIYSLLFKETFTRKH